MSRWIYVVALVTLALAACGGGNDTPPDAATATQRAALTIAAYQALATWTPAPPQTPAPPRPTINYTYAAPTLPTFTIDYARLTQLAPATGTPTRTPVPVISGTPGPIILDITVATSAINTRVETMLAPVAGGFFAQPPRISVEGDQLVASLNVLIRQSDPGSARPVIIEATVSAEGSGIALQATSAYFTDDGADYEAALVDSILFTVETAIDGLIADALEDGGAVGATTVQGVSVSGAGVTVETMTEASG